MKLVYGPDRTRAAHLDRNRLMAALRDAQYRQDQQEIGRLIELDSELFSVTLDDATGRVTVEWRN